MAGELKATKNDKVVASSMIDDRVGRKSGARPAESCPDIRRVNKGSFFVSMGQEEELDNYVYIDYK